MKPIRSWILLPILLLLVTGCEKPNQANQSPPPVDAPAESEPAPPPNETEAGPVDNTGAFEPVAEAAENPATSEPEPPERVDTILDVYKSKGKILITGHLRSRFQEEDMLRILSHNFPDHKVTTELDLGEHVNIEGGWGNRVSSIIIPLFLKTGETGRFRFENGVVTLEGTVEDKASKDYLHRQVTYVMEAADVNSIDLKLEIAKK